MSGMGHMVSCTGHRHSRLGTAAGLQQRAASRLSMSRAHPSPSHLVQIVTPPSNQLKLKEHSTALRSVTKPWDPHPPWSTELK